MTAGGGFTWRSVVGKLWNAPNTAVGLAYGTLGLCLGALNHRLRRQDGPPKVFWKGNALQFTNNPLGGVGAITLGNITVWHGDPFDPADTEWHRGGAPVVENGHSYPDHETQHTYQGEQLGPLYLPSNLAGGLNAFLRGQGWHGDANWNERGPQRVGRPTPWLTRPPPK